ncbi:putative SP-containing protein [Vairimorpha necatrix]|uniref:SP-containing protein n=1 Tax=Vairimorpha necatrix TaxID=6039 RepID=A0AAX4JBI2_9MICR
MNILFYLCVIFLSSNKNINRLNCIREDIADIFFKDDPVSVLNKLLVEKYRTKQNTPKIEDFTEDKYNLQNSVFQREWELRFDHEVKKFLDKEEENFICTKNNIILFHMKTAINKSKFLNFEKEQIKKLEYTLADTILVKVLHYEEDVDDMLKCFRRAISKIQENLYIKKQLLEVR